MKEYRTKLARQFDKAFPPRESKYRTLIHAQYWDKHTLKPLCDVQGDSHTMSGDKRLIDCPKCLEVISHPKSNDWGAHFKIYCGCEVVRFPEENQ